VAEGFLAATRGSGLVCDINPDEMARLYGRQWTRFLTSCKTVLGVESGASVFDFTGEIQPAVEAYVKSNPQAEFEEVRARFFEQEDGKIRLNQISPRCFEAAALRTGMVLFEGDYSGILVPWRHYLPLRKDFGNIDSVVEHLRDSRVLQGYVDCTFEEVALNPAYSYRAFVRRFDEVIEEEFEARIGARLAQTRRSGSTWRQRAVRQLRACLFPVSHLLDYSLRYLLFAPLFRLWLQVPPRWRARIRPFIRPLRYRAAARAEFAPDRRNGRK